MKTHIYFCSLHHTESISRSNSTTHHLAVMYRFIKSTYQFTFFFFACVRACECVCVCELEAGNIIMHETVHVTVLCLIFVNFGDGKNNIEKKEKKRKERVNLVFFKVSSKESWWWKEGAKTVAALPLASLAKVLSSCDAVL